MNVLIGLLLVIPLGAVALTLLVRHLVFQRLVSLAASSATLIISLIVLASVDADGTAVLYVGGWDASGWVPFLTSRGYAVLRPQYRGSMGLGRRLWLTGDAEWGQKMQDDKDDGAAWLVEQGIADPERMAIFGYSYGGFAAAAAKAP